MMKAIEDDRPLGLGFSEGLGGNAQVRVRERPILFISPMVRALLAGTKTQTRRVWKMPRGCDWYAELGGERDGWFVDHGQPWWLHVGECRCPYGRPGDRLWVRESFSGPRHQERHPPRDWHSTDPIHYWADGNPTLGDWTKPRPGMFMPRWACRIILEVTGVRAERLNDISRGDAMAEGCPFPNMAAGPDPRQWYAELWDAINGAGAWNANPWVWVVEFQRRPDLPPNVAIKPPVLRSA